MVFLPAKEIRQDMAEEERLLLSLLIVSSCWAGQDMAEGGKREAIRKRARAGCRPTTNHSLATNQSDSREGAGWLLIGWIKTAIEMGGNSREGAGWLGWGRHGGEAKKISENLCYFHSHPPL